jgi:hypothetical protein
MDYPFFNFLFTLGLILCNSIGIGLSYLLSRMNPALARKILPFLLLSLLPNPYIFYLLYRSSLPAFFSQVAIGLILIAGIIAVITVLLSSRIQLYPTAQTVILIGLFFSILANLTILYILYRSLVPRPLF